ncbi:MAG: DNA/RNA non-specific endonuclease [Prevotella sp.]|jgi:endonuclease G|nr:DNA/RNA non-specific endonuclease [Prevotella sp.]MCH3993082.1 DNA/RNA non-specific endonuclease [Prevotella sp.]MCI1474967.1 DNA/RNA non-specific endonuclease [Prevotella sp.]MCI1519404.1 DNA/RNA non-specific endonuclease [Prevotella sp.]MCI1549900.1 DNA/RNA non-specific endonuclease [Prevotella sp.]MCI1596869.1 DNA/RNA non-specific endonuclease [Prevotella sp.]
MNPFRITYLSALTFFIFTFTACSSNNGDNGSQELSENTNRNVVTSGMATEITRLEFPRVYAASNDTIVVHYAPEPGSDKKDVNYSLAWDKVKKANLFTCYEMYARNVQHTPGVNRYSPVNWEDQYPQDPDIWPKYRWDTDPFRGSGYDHGHLCPSADRMYSTTANYQTFFLSNMSAQVHGFNAGIWEVMENQLRDWISANSPVTDTLYVCKGGTISDGNYILGKNNLIVPKHFFSAVLMKNKEGYKAIGFWFENANNTTTSQDLRPYIVNIETLQKDTGLDFFCNLPDKTEKEVEDLDVSKVKRAWGFN